jgi:lipopolysaccharide export system permease protein
LSFTFLAIPLGIKVGRSESYANFMLALGLALVYYLGIIIIGWLEKNPSLRPDLLIWIPNLIFQALGFYFFNKVLGR